ncbi:MAG TPA: hypothetical protein VJM34_10555 [Novosphingobium sp.]|nr:hypothetical protein [Novosphingobium sp.]
MRGMVRLHAHMLTQALYPALSLRAVIVCGCAFALIAAGNALPF